MRARIGDRRLSGEWWSFGCLDILWECPRIESSIRRGWLYVQNRDGASQLETEFVHNGYSSNERVTKEQIVTKDGWIRGREETRLEVANIYLNLGRGTESTTIQYFLKGIKQRNSTSTRDCCLLIDSITASCKIERIVSRYFVLRVNLLFVALNHLSVSTVVTLYTTWF
jgi:hypothetical protein